MATIDIQGIACSYRDLREGEEILYAEFPQEQQYFRRLPAPFTVDESAQLWTVNYEERKAKYTPPQAQWVAREDRRMEYGQGVYAMINGALTYIPGSYWGYINYWLLEFNNKPGYDELDRDKPDYREDDRIFFLWLEYLYFETPVLGATRGKGRRQGASSLGFYWMWWICGRCENQIGGSLSYNDTKAQDNFQMMFLKGLGGLLPCFARDISNKSENYVDFSTAPPKGRRPGTYKKEGLKSSCDFLPNGINAYDGGRATWLMPDETGKYDKMNINTYWSKVFPTLRVGRKKVGMAYMPTTVNPPKKGGEHYKKFWDDANQNAINPKTDQPYGLKTKHGVVRYFVPATHGYAGCIDKFGASVVEDPNIPVMSNDGEWITRGSLSIILEERALKDDDEQLLEHRRDFPLDEYDMFSFYQGTCEFKEKNFIAQLKWLEENPVYLRKCRFYREETKKKNKFNAKEEIFDLVKYMDDDAAGWLLFEPPEVQNLYDHRGRMRPMNTTRYTIGVDTVKSGFTSGGSMATICVFKKSHIVEGVEKGLYPVALYMGKPHIMQHLFEEVLKACIWYGCKANFEIDAGSHFYDYFVAKDADLFLEWTPRVAIDPIKKHPLIEPGSRSGNPYQFAMQLEVAKKYFDGTIPDGYNGNIHRVVFPMMIRQGLEYNHSDRTKSDIIISLMMALLPCFGSLGYIDPAPLKPKQLLRTYKLKMVS